MINGHTRTCGLMGNPVEHTMSPLIHNFLAEKMGINLTYVPFCVDKERVEEALKGAFALNILGLNVTVPYKSRVLPYLAGCDAAAKVIGAVNTLVRTEAGFIGYNTDMPGLYRAMEQQGIRLKGEDVLILGAGGVARAVAHLMAEKGTGQIIILNRTLEKAREVTREVNENVGYEAVKAMRLSDHERLPEGKRFLAIQATNVGMHPDVDAAIIEDADFYHRIHTGYDLVFNPTGTRFMALTKSCGGKAFNGSRMLLYQAIIAFELWTDHKVPDELAEEAYNKLMDSRQF